MVRNFQRVIGDEARRQILEQEEALAQSIDRMRWRWFERDRAVLSVFWKMRLSKCLELKQVEEGIIPEKHAARFQGGSLGVPPRHPFVYSPG